MQISNDDSNIKKNINNNLNEINLNGVEEAAEVQDTDTRIIESSIDTQYIEDGSIFEIGDNIAPYIPVDNQSNDDDSIFGLTSQYYNSGENLLLSSDSLVIKEQGQPNNNNIYTNNITSVIDRFNKISTDDSRSVAEAKHDAQEKRFASLKEGLSEKSQKQLDTLNEKTIIVEDIIDSMQVRKESDIQEYIPNNNLIKAQNAVTADDVDAAQQQILSHLAERNIEMTSTDDGRILFDGGQISYEEGKFVSIEYDLGDNFTFNAGMTNDSNEDSVILTVTNQNPNEDLKNQDHVALTQRHDSYTTEEGAYRFRDDISTISAQENNVSSALVNSSTEILTGGMIKEQDNNSLNEDDTGNTENVASEEQIENDNSTIGNVEKEDNNENLTTDENSSDEDVNIKETPEDNTLVNAEEENIQSDELKQEDDENDKATDDISSDDNKENDTNLDIVEGNEVIEEDSNDEMDSESLENGENSDDKDDKDASDDKTKGTDNKSE